MNSGDWFATIWIFTPLLAGLLGRSISIRESNPGLGLFCYRWLTFHAFCFAVLGIILVTKSFNATNSAIETSNYAASAAFVGIASLFSFRCWLFEKFVPEDPDYVPLGYRFFGSSTFTADGMVDTVTVAKAANSTAASGAEAMAQTAALKKTAAELQLETEYAKVRAEVLRKAEELDHLQKVEREYARQSKRHD